MQVAFAYSRSPGWAQWSQQRSYLPSGTARLLKEGGSLPRGWDWYHGNGQPAARPSCWASVNGEIRIVRKMFIHGARAAVLRVKRGLETRAARNVVIVATAKRVFEIRFSEVCTGIGDENTVKRRA